MRAFLFFLLIMIPLQALSYPTIGARAREVSGQADLKVVDFTIRNNLEDRVDGYFYTIRMFDAYGDRILSAGQIPEGYRDVDLPPGGSIRERIYVSCRATPIRTEVEVMLVVPTEEGFTVIR